MVDTGVLYLHQDLIRSHLMQHDIRHYELSFGLLYYKRLSLQWERECLRRLGMQRFRDDTGGCQNLPGEQRQYELESQYFLLLALYHEYTWMS